MQGNIVGMGKFYQDIVLELGFKFKCYNAKN